MEELIRSFVSRGLLIVSVLADALSYPCDIIDTIDKQSRRLLSSHSPVTMLPACGVCRDTEAPIPSFCRRAAPNRRS